MTAEHDALREALIYDLWVADGGPGWTVANVSDAERCQAERREALYGTTVDRIIAALPQHAAAVLGVLGTVREDVWICPGCGRSYWPGLHPSKWKGSTIHVTDPRSSSSGNCEAMPIPGVWVSLGAAAKETGE